MVRASDHIRRFQIALRASCGGIIAAAIATVLSLQHPVYSLIAAIMDADLDPAKIRQTGLWRFAGNAIGATTGAALSQIFGSGVVTAGLGVFAAMMITFICKLDSAAKTSGYVAAIVLLNYSTDPWTYAFYRFTETTIGIAVAVLIGFVPPLLSRLETR